MGTELIATPAIVVIDNAATPLTGTTRISYSKFPPEEFWEIPAGSTSWTRVNHVTLEIRTGREGDAVDANGRFRVTLSPGQTYRAGIFRQDQGPLSSDPLQLAEVTVFALRKMQASLIMTEDRDTRGTFHRHTVSTNVPTRVALFGASLQPPTFDIVGIPSLVDGIGAPGVSLAAGTSHTLDVLPLVPGNHYFFAALVVDGAGNWDMRTEELDTLRRKLTIKIPRIHIFNDGDADTPGFAKFGFRVIASDPSGSFRNTLEEFSLPEMDIDDWSETDRPYAVGFAYVELEPMSIPPQRPEVWVSSDATEDDFLASDGAGNLKGRPVSLPAGPSEQVTNDMFTVDCPPTTDGSSFHYSVEVNYSVEYS